jgi:hypothetical protein
VRYLSRLASRRIRIVNATAAAIDEAQQRREYYLLVVMSQLAASTATKEIVPEGCSGRGTNYPSDFRCTTPEME